jgi:hypothetical protein
VRPQRKSITGIEKTKVFLSFTNKIFIYPFAGTQIKSSFHRVGCETYPTQIRINGTAVSIKR